MDPALCFLPRINQRTSGSQCQPTAATQAVPFDWVCAIPEDQIQPAALVPNDSMLQLLCRNSHQVGICLLFRKRNNKPNHKSNSKSQKAEPYSLAQKPNQLPYPSSAFRVPLLRVHLVTTLRAHQCYQLQHELLGQGQGGSNNQITNKGGR